MTLKTFSRTNSQIEQYIKIDHHKRSLSGVIRIFKIQDGEFIVAFAPALNMTAYGRTVKKAMNMFKDILGDYCDTLIISPPGKVTEELKKYGWRKNRIFKKNYTQILLNTCNYRKQIIQDLRRPRSICGQI